MDWNSNYSVKRNKTNITLYERALVGDIFDLSRHWNMVICRSSVINISIPMYSTKAPNIHIIYDNISVLF